MLVPYRVVVISRSYGSWPGTHRPTLSSLLESFYGFSLDGRVRNNAPYLFEVDEGEEEL
jgi:hypothetical protein